TFSPSNNNILFVAPETELGYYDKIFRVDINGNNEELIVELGSVQSTPVYSSMGDRIIFSALSHTELRIDIYVKNISKNIISKLTNSNGSTVPRNDYPDWNPAK